MSEELKELKRRKVWDSFDSKELRENDTPYSERPLIDEMIAHCPTLDRIDCIGLIEMVLQRYGRGDNLRGTDHE